MKVQSMFQQRETMDPKEWVNKQHERHVRNNFKWLDSDTASRYYKKYMETNRDAASQKRLSDELRKIYGVTDIEAINIVNGRNVGDYINKYERIKTRTPVLKKSGKNEKEDFS